ncbi:MAG: glycosyltransferase [Anaerolineae bacterium]|nr:glycosyltransferase [Anaerolineae bacterium]
MPTISVIGAFKAHYPRNQILRAGLEACGWEVRAAPIPSDRRTFGRLGLLWRTMHQEAPTTDVFLLAAFNQLIAPFALLFGRWLGRPVAVDYLVGLYDSAVQDRETLSPRSLKAAIWRTVDRINCALAPLIFTDTAAHRTAFRTIVGAAADRLGVVPVGVYPEWWHPGLVPDTDPARRDLLIQFFGTYIPFHGVEVILEAAHLLRHDPRLRFELIGRGQTYAAMRRRAEALGVANVTFVDPVPPPELPARVAAADICLGVFGARAKTDYVVPNKLFQCLALGKPVITAESAAVREFFTPGEHLLTVPPGDARALAAAIRALVEAPDERARLGAGAATAIGDAFTPASIVRSLLPELGALVDRPQERRR